MRAFRLLDHTRPPELVEIDDTLPKSGDVKIAVKAAGLNFADLLMVKGSYQDTPNAPFTLGLEAAGEILESGSESDLKVGDRVAAYAPFGALSDRLTVSAARVSRIPDDMPFDHAVTFPVAYGTSHIALHHLAQLRPGERLFVSGAAGGVGLTAVEIGKLLGAEVIAHARGADKLAIAQAAGADHLIDDGADIRTALKDLGGVDVVYDPVGGDVFRAAFRATNPGGRLLPIGFAGGDVPQIPANHLLVKNLTVIGFYIGGYAKAFPHVMASSMDTLFGWYSDGKLRPHIGATFPLEKTQEGLELLRRRAATGKVVITP